MRGARPDSLLLDQCCVADSRVFLRQTSIQHSTALFMTAVNNSWARASINMCQRRLICRALQTKMENIVVTMTNVCPHYPPGWRGSIKPISVRVLEEERLSAAPHQSLWINSAISQSRSRAFDGRAGILSSNDRLRYGLWGNNNIQILNKWVKRQHSLFFHQIVLGKD